MNPQAHSVLVVYHCGWQFT